MIPDTSIAHRDAPLTAESAMTAWVAVRADQHRHMEQCWACRPTIAICSAGQGLAELERASWSLLRRARAAEGMTP